MEQLYELDINISKDLNIHYIQNNYIANVFINNLKKNLLTKSAEAMTFKGLLNLIAFYTQSNNYAIAEDGTILYANIIDIGNDMYLQLEDSLEYFDELEADILSDFDNGYQITLYSKTNQYENDIEIAAYDLNDSVKDLFQEIEDFRTNDLYRLKINLDHRLEELEYQVNH